MPALRELQSHMATAIHDAATSERLEPRIVAGLAQPERLALHARNFRAGLTAALASIFSATQRLAGEGFFAFAAAQFIATSPPRDPIVARYGADFPGFLAGLPALARSPWLADAARLEWAVHALSDYAPAAPLDLAALAHLSDARFTFSPAAALFSAQTPAAELIDPDGDLAVLNLAQACHLLLAAGPGGVVQHLITAKALAFLSCLHTGQPLSAALEATPPSAVFDPVATLRLAARLGCFAALHPIQDTP